MATIVSGPGDSSHPWNRLVDVQRWSLRPDVLVGIEQPAQRGSSRDSLKNGAAIGAVVGAVGLGALGALICNLYQEEGGASCLPDTLRVAAIGAAIGIGAGVAVDAAPRETPVLRCGSASHSDPAAASYERARILKTRRCL
jgi:hypothetical protein